MQENKPVVAILMGSNSDWDVMKNAAEMSRYLKGQDSLYSIVQMPKGVPVATFAIGEAGAANAALYAVQILGTTDAVLADKLAAFRKAQNEKARNMTLPL